MKENLRSYKTYFFGIIFLGFIVILPALLLEKIVSWSWYGSNSINTTKYIFISYVLYFIVLIGILIPIIKKISSFLELKKRNTVDNINTVIIFLVSIIPLFIVIKTTMLLIKKISKHKYRTFHCGLSVALFLRAVKVNVHGERSRLAKIFIANHTSDLDYLLLPWVMGISPFNILAGFNLKENKKTLEDKIISWSLGGIIENYSISVDREDKRSMFKAYYEMEKEIENGKNFGVFPEGTRLPMEEIIKGKIIGEFKKGAFFLAWKKKIPIQIIVFEFPAVYRGKKDHRWGIHPCTIDVYYLDIAFPEDYSCIEDFMLACYQIMEAKLKDSKKVRTFLSELADELVVA